MEIGPDNLRHHLSWNSDFFRNPQYVFQLHLDDLRHLPFSMSKNKFLIFFLRPPPALILLGSDILPKPESSWSPSSPPSKQVSHTVSTCPIKWLLQTFIISPKQILLRSASSGLQYKVHNLTWHMWSFLIHSQPLLAPSSPPMFRLSPFTFHASLELATLPSQLSKYWFTI